MDQQEIKHFGKRVGATPMPNSQFKVRPRFRTHCTMYGGVSGILHQVGIVGALTSYGNQNRLWLNSWLMLPSTVATVGDSGSLVSINSTSEAVRLLVGGSRAANVPWYLCWYAQDLFSIQNDVLSSINLTLA